MISTTIIYIDIEKNIVNVHNISFENDFEFRQFLYDVEEQENISDAENYLKIQIWSQKQFENSKLIMEKEFCNGEIINKPPKITKEGTILQFPLAKDKL